MVVISSQFVLPQIFEDLRKSFQFVAKVNFTGEDWKVMNFSWNKPNDISLKDFLSLSLSMFSLLRLYSLLSVDNFISPTLLCQGRSFDFQCLVDNLSL